jgi:hypothetical protein
MEAARMGTAPEGEAAQHIATCAECGVYYREQLALTNALKGLAETPAPAWIGARILAERRRGPQAIGLGWQVGAAAVMATLLAVGIAIVPRQAKTPTAPAEPFIEIPYVAPLAPYEMVQVRRMEVPVAALIAAGLDVGARQAGTSVSADVLLGQDGRIHAIRIDHN